MQYYQLVTMLASSQNRAASQRDALDPGAPFEWFNLQYRRSGREGWLSALRSRLSPMEYLGTREREVRILSYGTCSQESKAHF